MPDLELEELGNLYGSMFCAGSFGNDLWASFSNSPNASVHKSCKHDWLSPWCSSKKKKVAPNETLYLVFLISIFYYSKIRTLRVKLNVYVKKEGSILQTSRALTDTHTKKTVVEIVEKQ